MKRRGSHQRNAKARKWDKNDSRAIVSLGLCRSGLFLAAFAHFLLAVAAFIMVIFPGTIVGKVIAVIAYSILCGILIMKIRKIVRRDESMQQKFKRTISKTPREKELEQTSGGAHAARR